MTDTPTKTDVVRVIERIAAAQSSDPMTDDLTVPLAFELAEKDATIAALKANAKEGGDVMGENVRLILALALGCWLLVALGFVAGRVF